VVLLALGELLQVQQLLSSHDQISDGQPEGNPAAGPHDDGAGHEGVDARCERVATTCGLDGDRLFAWSQVIAPMAAIAYLAEDGPAQVITTYSH
jgi:hypothetical protein